jgi:hypothetical protein
MAEKKTEKKVETPVVIATPETVEVDVTPVSSEYDFEVSEPLIIKPQDLPLVVTPGAGKTWVNEAQAEYAKTLNGYAYKNPKKWATKKAKMLSNLTRLATEPSYINFLRGAEDENTKLTYSNKLMEA